MCEELLAGIEEGRISANLEFVPTASLRIFALALQGIGSPARKASLRSDSNASGRGSIMESSINRFNSSKILPAEDKSRLVELSLRWSDSAQVMKRDRGKKSVEGWSSRGSREQKTGTKASKAPSRDSDESVAKQETITRRVVILPVLLEGIQKALLHSVECIATVRLIDFPLNKAPKEKTTRVLRAIGMCNRLAVLCLDGCPLNGDHLMTLLATSRAFSRLEEASLARCQLTDRCQRGLVSFLRLHRDYEVEAAWSMSLRGDGSIEEKRMSSKAGAQTLSGTLNSLANTKGSANSPNGGSLLTSRVRGIVVWNLSGNALGDATLITLGTALLETGNTALQQLNLSNNRISSSGLQRFLISEALENSGIRFLDLTGNPVKIDGTVYGLEHGGGGSGDVSPWASKSFHVTVPSSVLIKFAVNTDEGKLWFLSREGGWDSLYMQQDAPNVKDASDEHFVHGTGPADKMLGDIHLSVPTSPRTVSSPYQKSSGSIPGEPFSSGSVVSASKSSAVETSSRKWPQGGWKGAGESKMQKNADVLELQTSGFGEHVAGRHGLRDVASLKEEEDHPKHHAQASRHDFPYYPSPYPHFASPQPHDPSILNPPNPGRSRSGEAAPGFFYPPQRYPPPFPPPMQMDPRFGFQPYGYYPPGPPHLHGYGHLHPMLPYWDPTGMTRNQWTAHYRRGHRERSRSQRLYSSKDSSEEGSAALSASCSTCSSSQSRQTHRAGGDASPAFTEPYDAGHSPREHRHRDGGRGHRKNEPRRHHRRARGERHRHHHHSHEKTPQETGVEENTVPQSASLPSALEETAFRDPVLEEKVENPEEELKKWREEGVPLAVMNLLKSRVNEADVISTPFLAALIARLENHENDLVEKLDAERRVGMERLRALEATMQEKLKLLEREIREVSRAAVDAKEAVVLHETTTAAEAAVEKAENALRKHRVETAGEEKVLMEMKLREELLELIQVGLQKLKEQLASDGKGTKPDPNGLKEFNQNAESALSSVGYLERYAETERMREHQRFVASINNRLKVKGW